MYYTHVYSVCKA